MSVEGVVDIFAREFPDDQIPKIIRLILNSWPTLKMPSELLEVPITKVFCSHLINNKNNSLHFFRIHWEPHVLDDQGNEIGRIDLMFTQGVIESVYFSIECKLLRTTRPSGRFDSLAGEYVTQGMRRYFNGQYAQGLDKGGMLAYVMDGDMDKAVDDVKIAIENRRTGLFMQDTETLHPSSAISSKQVKETSHLEGGFTIYHIFLSVN